MAAAPNSPEAVISLVDQYTSMLRAQIGSDQAKACLQLVQELIARLPHKYLLAATREEIKAAGRIMSNEGRTPQQMKALQYALVGLLNHAFRSGALPSHPLHEDDGNPASPPAPLEAALVIGQTPAQVEAIRELLDPPGIAISTASSHQAAAHSLAWFPFAYILSSLPTVAPIKFFASVRAIGSLCRDTGLVLLARDEQVKEATTYVGRGANRVVRLSDLSDQLPREIAELGMVSERIRIRITVHAKIADGERTAKWQSENISSTGMLLRTREELAKGTQLDLRFQVPGHDHPVKVRAEVVRATTFGREAFNGCGVLFLSFVGEGQHRIETFLRPRSD